MDTTDTDQPLLDDLDRMANDPEIQQELRQIEREFAETEADGLTTA